MKKFLLILTIFVGLCTSSCSNSSNDFLDEQIQISDNKSAKKARAYRRLQDRYKRIWYSKIYFNHPEGPASNPSSYAYRQDWIDVKNSRRGSYYFNSKRKTTSYRNLGRFGSGRWDVYFIRGWWSNSSKIDVFYRKKGQKHTKSFSGYRNAGRRRYSVNINGQPFYSYKTTRVTNSIRYHIF